MSASTTMPITLNGAETTVPTGSTIARVLESTGYADAVVAVAVNGTFAPKSTHDSRRLAPGDAVEVVAPMAGG